MQFNYYTLKRLTSVLEEELIGAEFIEGFSQSKDELILHFQKKDDNPFFIRCTLLPALSTISFPAQFHKSKKNVVSLFTALNALKIKDLKQFENERAFALKFDNEYTLLFKLHGSRANLVLYKDKEVTALFKNKLAKDRSITLESLDRPLVQTKDAYLKSQELFELFPTFDKTIKNYLNQRGFKELDPHKQWALLEDTLTIFSSGSFYLLQKDEQIKFSLLPLEDFEQTDLGNEIIPALNAFYRSISRKFFVNNEKQLAVKRIDHQIKKAESYIKKTSDKLKELEHADSPKQLADIIMANLHALKPGMDKAELFDFYNNRQVCIKLNKELSPQLNAERYYKKSKNRRIEIETLRKNIAEKEQQLLLLFEEKEQIESIEDSKELKKLSKTNKQSSKPVRQVPYKSFEIDGFQVWVGKNAKANDELTLKHAYKEDVWLHAKDCPGSHVLIKHQAGKSINKYTIEKVAQLAAYYSKRKTDSLVPVIFTPAKYVRKRKGSPAGQVVVDREEVIMVPPQSPQH